jgi:Ca2+-binding RTX toxin-like protein
MATPVKWGGELNIDAGSGPPSVKALADGRFVAAYTNLDGTPAVSTGIFSQLFNGDGTKSGTEVHVNTTTPNAQQSPVITAFDNGGFVVAWEDWSGAQVPEDSNSVFESINVRAQLFTSLGAKAGTEFVVNTEHNADQDSPTITTLTNGNWVAAWSDDSWVTESSSVTRVQAFSGASATHVNSEFIVSPDPQSDPANANDSFDPSIAALSNGNYVVTWTDFGHHLSDTLASSIHGQIYQANGTVVGIEFQANTTATGSQFASASAPLASGKFVVVWTEDQDSNPATNGTTNDTIRAQIFKADGTPDPNVAELHIKDSPGHDQTEPAVATLNDGRFIVAWTSASGAAATFDTDIHARLFNADGTPSGSEFTVNTDKNGEQTTPSIDVLADGRVIIAWVTSNGSHDGSHAQIFDPRESAVTLNGTTLGDQFYGTAFADKLHGLNGNDILSGGGAGDTLTGDVGNDTLKGEAGNDTLSGGAGIDKLDGGAGKDSYSGSAGDDHFIFAARTDSAVGANRDTISDFATGGTLEKIDLHSIFAGTLTFIGQHVFTGKVGEVCYAYSGAQTIVKVNLDHDLNPEMEIGLTNGHLKLTANDFML